MAPKNDTPAVFKAADALQHKNGTALNIPLRNLAQAYGVKDIEDNTPQAEFARLLLAEAACEPAHNYLKTKHRNKANSANATRTARTAVEENFSIPEAAKTL